MKSRLILLMLIAISTVCAAEEWNKSYKVGDAPQLTVFASDAGIEVHAGGNGSITATLETRGYTLTGGDPDIRVTDSQAGDNVTITAKERSRTRVCFGCTRSAHLSITAPAGTRLSLKTSDGSLKVFDIKAPADLHTSDGSIEVRGFDGVLHARTSDGSMTVSGRFDDLRLDTSDGSITLEVQRGSKVTTDWRLHTSDGSIRAALPEDLSAEVNLSTGDGSIHSDLSINDVHGPMSKRSLTGKLNGGGRLLEMRTSDGSIHLTRL
jgi:phage tail sheath gpL-like